MVNKRRNVYRSILLSSVMCASAVGKDPLSTRSLTRPEAMIQTIKNEEQIRDYQAITKAVKAESEQKTTGNFLSLDSAAESLQQAINGAMEFTNIKHFIEPVLEIGEQVADTILDKINPHTQSINIQMEKAKARALAEGKTYNATMNKVAWHGYCVTKTILNWYANTPVARHTFSLLFSNHMDRLITNFHRCMPDPNNLEDIKEFNLIETGLKALQKTITLED